MAAVDPLSNAGYKHEAAFDSGHLRVDSIHEVYYEQYGQKNGLPVVFLHGGPGAHTSPGNTKYFNPAVYRVVLLDQRGAGKSRPRNELRENTTFHLVEDIEKLREHLSIDKWHMAFGGSWGVTLALLYAQAYPDRVGSLVLRGIFTATEPEFSAMTSNTAQFFPEVSDEFISFLPKHEQSDTEAGYYKRLTSSDPETVAAAARAWNKRDLSLGSLRPSPDAYARLEDREWSVTHALFESHYSRHGAWLDNGHILKPENMAKMQHIHGAIVQGRYDTITPPKTAWELHKAWPKSSLYLIEDAGHIAGEPGTAARLIQVCDEFAKL